MKQAEKEKTQQLAKQAADQKIASQAIDLLKGKITEFDMELQMAVDSVKGAEKEMMQLLLSQAKAMMAQAMGNLTDATPIPFTFSDAKGVANDLSSKIRTVCNACTSCFLPPLMICGNNRAAPHWNNVLYCSSPCTLEYVNPGEAATCANSRALFARTLKKRS